MWRSEAPDEFGAPPPGDSANKTCPMMVSCWALAAPNDGYVDQMINGDFNNQNSG